MPFDFQLDFGTGPFSVSDERAALFSEILRAPRDDEAKQVYADLALSEGDPRGEFVRLGLLQDRARGTDADHQIKLAMKHLRARYGRAIFAEWFGSPLSAQLGFISRVSGYRGGFLSRIDMSTATDVEVEEVFRLAPLTGISLPQVGTERRRLKLKALCRAVGDFGNQPSVQALADLTNAPTALTIRAPVLAGNLSRASLQLSEVERLSLWRGGADPILTYLRDHSPKLRSVVANVGASGLDALARFPALVDAELHVTEPAGPSAETPSLQTLAVRGALSPSLGRWIARSGVRELRVRLEGDVEPGFFSALDGSSLERFSVYGGLSEEALGGLAQLTLPKLSSLSVGGSRAGAGLVALKRLSDQASTLALPRNELGADELTAVLPLLEGKTELDLTGNVFKSKGAKALTKSGHLATVKSARFSGAKIGKGAARAMFEVFHVLEELRWFKNGTNLQGLPIQAVADMPHLAKMKQLHIVGGGKNEAALIALARSKHARNLQELKVNKVTPAAMNELCESPHLLELGLLGEFRAKSAPEVVREAALRRFGHRLDMGYGERVPLMEPDLDPWWGG